MENRQQIGTIKIVYEDFENIIISSTENGRYFIVIFGMAFSYSSEEKAREALIAQYGDTTVYKLELFDESEPIDPEVLKTIWDLFYGVLQDNLVEILNDDDSLEEIAEQKMLSDRSEKDNLPPVAE